MPEISISDALFARAQLHAVPLIDTIETVFGKALDALEGKALPTPASRSDEEGSVRPYDPDNPPNLTYSQPISMKIDGEEIPKVQLYWNQLMHKLIAKAVDAGYTGRDLLRLMVVPAVAGVKTDQGYNVFSSAGISVQGQDSNGAWKQARHLAALFGVKLEIVFRWQNTPKAVHPTKQGSFTVVGTKSKL